METLLFHVQVDSFSLPMLFYGDGTQFENKEVNILVWLIPTILFTINSRVHASGLLWGGLSDRGSAYNYSQHYNSTCPSAKKPLLKHKLYTC